MHDRLGGDEGKRHHAAEEIVARADAEGTRAIDEQRIARHEIQRAVIPRRSIVFAAELKALQLGKGARNGAMRRALVLILRAWSGVRDDGPAPHPKAARGALGPCADLA